MRLKFADTKHVATIVIFLLSLISNCLADDFTHVLNYDGMFFCVFARKEAQFMDFRWGDKDFIVYVNILGIKSEWIIFWIDR